ncbi:MAG TPA: SRPBCC family protein [Steroidobacteraceae bacterium]|nr:SRPBCC family protein [Steroidobacteraceae bacterium]
MRSARSSRTGSTTGTLVATLVVVAVAGSLARANEALQTKVTRQGRVLQVRATLAADTPASTCFAVLVDFDRLEDFIPGLVSSDVLSAPGEPIVLRQVGDAKAAFFRVALDVTLAVKVHPPERIEFERLDGNLRRMQGDWTVAGDEHHCDIVYRADIEPAFWVPPLIGPRLMRNQVETQLEGLLQELHRRKTAGAAP